MYSLCVHSVQADEHNTCVSVAVDFFILLVIISGIKEQCLYYRQLQCARGAYLNTSYRPWLLGAGL